MSFRFLFLTACLLLATPGSAETATPLVVTHVTVIDATGAPPKRDMTVVIIGNRITALGKASEVEIPPGARVVEAKGKFLIPGLWDMHVHVFNQVSRRPPNTWYFPLFMANGVTSVREMWTKPEDMDQVREWRRLQVEGNLLAPRIAAVGTLVDGPAGAETTQIGSALPGPTANIVRSPDKARQFVRDVKAAGVNFVKTYSSLSRDAFLAIADEAKKQGIPFAGHVPFVVGAGEASSVGQRSMEHLNQIMESSSSRSAELFQVPGREWSSTHEKLMLDSSDQKRFTDLIAVLAKNQTWQVPTLVVWRRQAFPRDRARNDPRLRYVPVDEVANWEKLFPNRNATQAEKVIRRRLWREQLKVVRWMNNAGVPFMAGTDLGTNHIYPGFSLHDELALLVEAGLTPMQALQTATRNPADFLGLSDSVGTVGEGKIADLVLLDANPLRDIRNTQKIRGVVLNGQYLDRAQLDRLLAQAEAAAKKN